MPLKMVRGVPPVKTSAPVSVRVQEVEVHE
jgi:hypothetical protein